MAADEERPPAGARRPRSWPRTTFPTSALYPLRDPGQRRHPDRCSSRAATRPSATTCCGVLDLALEDGALRLCAAAAARRRRARASAAARAPHPVRASGRAALRATRRRARRRGANSRSSGSGWPRRRPRASMNARAATAMPTSVNSHWRGSASNPRDPSRGSARGRRRRAHEGRRARGRATRCPRRRGSRSGADPSWRAGTPRPAPIRASVRMLLSPRPEQRQRLAGGRPRAEVGDQRHGLPRARSAAREYVRPRRRPRLHLGGAVESSCSHPRSAPAATRRPPRRRSPQCRARRARPRVPASSRTSVVPGDGSQLAGQLARAG